METQSVALELIHELYAERLYTCCPYLRHDERGCYCASPAVPKWWDAYMPCDVYSVQLWCLTATHYTKCCLWPAADAP